MDSSPEMSVISSFKRRRTDTSTPSTSEEKVLPLLSGQPHEQPSLIPPPSPKRQRCEEPSADPPRSSEHDISESPQNTEANISSEAEGAAPSKARIIVRGPDSPPSPPNADGKALVLDGESSQTEDCGKYKDSSLECIEPEIVHSEPQAVKVEVGDATIDETDSGDALPGVPVLPGAGEGETGQISKEAVVESTITCSDDDNDDDDVSHEPVKDDPDYVLHAKLVQLDQPTEQALHIAAEKEEKADTMLSMGAAEALDSTSSPEASQIDFTMYFNMRRMGIPVGVLRNALSRDGKDPTILDLDPDKSHGDEEIGPPLRADPRYAMYFNLLAAGVPVGTVKNALRRDGKDASIMDLDPSKSLNSQLLAREWSAKRAGRGENRVAVNNDDSNDEPSDILDLVVSKAIKSRVEDYRAMERQVKDGGSEYNVYLNMLKMGLPRGVLKNALVREGKDVSVLDLDSYNSEAHNHVDELSEENSLSKFISSREIKSASGGIQHVHGDENPQLKCSPEYSMYFSMLKMGLPVEVLKNSLNRRRNDNTISSRHGEGALVSSIDHGLATTTSEDIRVGSNSAEQDFTQAEVTAGELHAAQAKDEYKKGSSQHENEDNAMLASDVDDGVGRQCFVQNAGDTPVKAVSCRETSQGGSEDYSALATENNDGAEQHHPIQPASNKPMESVPFDDANTPPMDIESIMSVDNVLLNQHQDGIHPEILSSEAENENDSNQFSSKDEPIRTIAVETAMSQSETMSPTDRSSMSQQGNNHVYASPADEDEGSVSPASGHQDANQNSLQPQSNSHTESLVAPNHSDERKTSVVDMESTPPEIGDAKNSGLCHSDFSRPEATTAESDPGASQPKVAGEDSSGKSPKNGHERADLDKFAVSQQINTQEAPPAELTSDSSNEQQISETQTKHDSNESGQTPLLLATPSENDTDSGIVGHAPLHANVDDAFATPSDSVPLKDDPSFAMYFNMLRMGMPRGVLKNVLTRDGKDPSVMDLDPNKSLKEQLRPTDANMLVEDLGQPLWEDPEYSKYFKMLKMGMPKDQVLHAMARDGKDPSILSLDPSWSLMFQRPGYRDPRISREAMEQQEKKWVDALKVEVETKERRLAEDGLKKKEVEAKRTAEASFVSTSEEAKRGDMPLKYDPEYSKYFKMLSMGMPKQQVLHAITRDKKDHFILDLEPSKSLKSQLPVDAHKPNISSGNPGDIQQQEKTLGNGLKVESYGTVETAENHSKKTAGDVTKEAGGDTDVALKEDPEYAKYFKMQKMGMSKEQVIHAMTRDEKDQTVLELDPNKSLKSQKVSEKKNDDIALKDDPEFAKYFKMLKMGLPRAQVLHAMKRDEIDQSILDLDPTKSLKSQREEENKVSEVALKDDPEYAKYFKMLKMGLPVGAVKNALTRDGKDPSIIDLDHNRSVKAQLSNANGDSGSSRDDSPPLKDDPEYSKYFKMLQMGLPVGAVKNALSRDGKDPSIMDLDHDKSLKSQINMTICDGPPLKDDPEFAKYFKMLSMGLPMGAVKNALSRDGKDPSIMDLDHSRSIRSQVGTGSEEKDTGVPLKDDPEYAKYFKMLSMGLPLGAVRNALERDGKNPNVLDMDPSKSVAFQSKASKANKASVKKKKKVRRKKVYWNPIDPSKLKEDSMWNIVRGAVDMGQLQYDEKEFENLFTETTDPSQKTNKKENKKEQKKLVQVIDPKRSMNGGIALSRLKTTYEKIAEYVNRMDHKKFDATQLKALKEYLPDADERRGLITYMKKGEHSPETRDTLYSDCSETEKYMVTMLDVQEAAAKLDAMLFRSIFKNRFEEATEGIRTLNSACDQVRSSEKLRKLMAMILAVVNQINTGGEGTMAMGFTLDALLKLNEAKAFDKKTSVLHYVVKLVNKNDKSLLEFDRDIASVGPAETVLLDGLSGDVKSISEELDSILEIVKKESDRLEQAGELKPMSLSDLAEQKTSVTVTGGVVQFNKMEHLTGRTSMERFVLSAKIACQQSSASIENIKKKYKALLQYFGEDEQMATADFFGTLSRFIAEWKKAADQVEAIEKKEAKERKREAARVAKAKAKNGRTSFDPLKKTMESVARVDNSSVGVVGDTAAGHPEGHSIPSSPATGGVAALAAAAAAKKQSNVKDESSKSVPPAADSIAALAAAAAAKKRNKFEDDSSNTGPLVGGGFAALGVAATKKRSNVDDESSTSGPPAAGGIAALAAAAASKKLNNVKDESSKSVPPAADSIATLAAAEAAKKQSNFEDDSPKYSSTVGGGIAALADAAAKKRSNVDDDSSKFGPPAADGIAALTAAAASKKPNNVEDESSKSVPPAADSIATHAAAAASKKLNNVEAESMKSGPPAAGGIAAIAAASAAKKQSNFEDYSSKSSPPAAAGIAAIASAAASKKLNNVEDESIKSGPPVTGGITAHAAASAAKKLNNVEDESVKPGPPAAVGIAALAAAAAARKLSDVEDDSSKSGPPARGGIAGLTTAAAAKEVNSVKDESSEFGPPAGGGIAALAAAAALKKLNYVEEGSSKYGPPAAGGIAVHATAAASEKLNDVNDEPSQSGPQAIGGIAAPVVTAATKKHTNGTEVALFKECSPPSVSKTSEIHHQELPQSSRNVAAQLVTTKEPSNDEDSFAKVSLPDDGKNAVDERCLDIAPPVSLDRENVAKIPLGIANAGEFQESGVVGGINSRGATLTPQASSLTAGSDTEGNISQRGSSPANSGAPEDRLPHESGSLSKAMPESSPRTRPDDDDVFHDSNEGQESPNIGRETTNYEEGKQAEMLDTFPRSASNVSLSRSSIASGSIKSSLSRGPLNLISASGAPTLDAFFDAEEAARNSLSKYPEYSGMDDSSVSFMAENIRMRNRASEMSESWAQGDTIQNFMGWADQAIKASDTDSVRHFEISQDLRDFDDESTRMTMMDDDASIMSWRSPSRKSSLICESKSNPYIEPPFDPSEIESSDPASFYNIHSQGPVQDDMLSMALTFPAQSTANGLDAGLSFGVGDAGLDDGLGFGTGGFGYLEQDTRLFGASMNDLAVSSQPKSPERKKSWFSGWMG